MTALLQRSSASRRRERTLKLPLQAPAPDPNSPLERALAQRLQQKNALNKAPAAKTEPQNPAEEPI